MVYWFNNKCIVLNCGTILMILVCFSIIKQNYFVKTLQPVTCSWHSSSNRRTKVYTLYHCQITCIYYSLSDVSIHKWSTLYVYCSRECAYVYGCACTCFCICVYSSVGINHIYAHGIPTMPCQSPIITWLNHQE